MGPPGYRSGVAKPKSKSKAPQLLRFIGNGSSVPDEAPPDDLTPERLTELYRWIVTIRAFDERAVALQRQGRIGTYPMCWGEEGAQCGSLFALEDRDWGFPSYRQQALPILRGVPPETIFRYRRGHGGKGGFWSPREVRMAPITISIATHLPHAVGLALAARLRGDDVCSIAWFGDGATSEGDFHEALNIAAVMGAATVFFCTNNQWAISTPFDRQSGVEAVVDKAKIYGMPAIRVDGFDPIACYEATMDALERARGGGGPTLIEALTYRLGPHATADDPSRYRDEKDAERWRALEPVGRTRAYLIRHGVFDEAGADSIEAEAKAFVSAGVEEMEKYPDPDPEVLFETTYASGLPYALREGLAEIQAVRGK